MNGHTTLGYWVEAPGRGALRPTGLPAAGAHDVELDALFTGISPGTERLIGRGHVPASCAQAMAVPGMQGSFALPILFGYSFVGIVSRGARAGRRAFTMHPHQQRAVVPSSRCVWLPDDVSSPRATLLPNLETAQNAVWDAELTSGEAVAVVGAGAIGLLVAFVLSRQHAGDVVLVDADAERRTFAASLPWVHRVAAPDELPRASRAVCFHATGTGRGLQLALDALGFEGRVIELSWYGSTPVDLQLGGAFHHQRQRIVSSQVGTIAKSHRHAGLAARTAAVVRLLGDSRLDLLLREPILFGRLPEFFVRLDRGEPTTPCPVVAYQGEPVPKPQP